MLVIQLDEMDGPRGVAILSRLITQWVSEDRHNNTIKLLAAKAQLRPQTVSRIWSQETSFPRLLTAMMILKALGFAAIRITK